MTVLGKEKCTISMFACRMRNYIADEPLTINNKKAVIQAIACIDKNEEIYTMVRD